MKRNGFIVFLIVLVIMTVFNDIFSFMNLDNERVGLRILVESPAGWLAFIFSPFRLQVCATVSLLPAFLIMLTWLKFRRLHPLSFLIIYGILLFIIFFSSFSLISMFGILGAFVAINFVASALIAGFPICWLSKQFCDEKGRDFSLNIKNSDKSRWKFMCSVICFAMCFLSILVFNDSINMFHSSSVTIRENDHRLITILIIKKLYFIVPIIAYFYLVAELLRKGKITMVKFTRIGILVHIAYVVLIFLIMSFVYHQYDDAIKLYRETGEIRGYVVFQAMRLFFYVVCYTSISFSLPFWLTGKILQLINRLTIRREENRSLKNDVASNYQ